MLNQNIIEFSKSIKNLHRYSHNAMATHFEIYIIHDDEKYAHQAATGAFQLLDRLEADLSRFVKNTDISRVNHHAYNEPVRVSQNTFTCITQGLEMEKLTNGAFNILTGSAISDYNSANVKLDEKYYTIRFLQRDIAVDLGGIGKGYAIDVMITELKDWDINTAFVHGGASSVYALGSLPEMVGWPVTISHPQTNEVLSTIYLKDKSLSGSGLQKGNHIIVPRTGKPPDNFMAAWALASSGTQSDAFSTAFMIMSDDDVENFTKEHVTTSCFRILNDGQIFQFGEEIIQYVIINYHSRI